MKILAGVFLGWSLGSNDAANVFGTAVSSQMVRWRTAAILIAVFALIGACLSGGPGLETLGKLTHQTPTTAFAASLAAALTVTMMTLLGTPVSTSQAVVGAVIGVGLSQNQNIDYGNLQQMVLCWIGTPIGAGLLSFILYPILAGLIRKANLHFFTYDKLMRTLLIAAGIYGAYALGANNVANVTGVFYQAGSFDYWGDDYAKKVALAVGGAAIGLGALTYSQKVMMTVGKKIIKLDAFSAFIVVLCEAIIVHIYAVIGVPVSTSQAVVGAVLGIGFLKGMHTVNNVTVIKIVLGWILTPIMGGAMSFGLLKMIHSLNY